MKNNLIYKKAVEWIALNDDPLVNDIHEVKNQISVVLISDVLMVPAKDLAKDILRYRRDHQI